jgi:acetate kinase
LQIPFLEYIELRYLIGLFTVVMAVIVIYRNFVIVFTGGIGKNGSTCAVSFLNKFANLTCWRATSYTS